MRVRTVTVVMAALVAVLLGACAGESGADGPEPGPTTGAPSAPPTSPVLPTLPSPSLPPRDGELTITGEVIEGVEAGCVLLATDTGDYLLFGEAAEGLAMGSTVTLRGQVRPDMASTCQQGAPFEVLEVLE